jgi:[ribosomal protein S5]-alanine N-acetyltransferase
MVSRSVSRVAAGVGAGLCNSLRAPSTIETARLALRRPQVADAPAVFARYASDPAVTRYLGWRTHVAVADTRVFLASCESEWRQSGVGPYLIHSRESGELLGSASLRMVSSQQAAAGYVLARDAWGRGYATEALHAMRGLALRLGVLRLTAMCHPDHFASCRVMQKCGFIREGLLRGHAQFPNLAPGVAGDVVCYSFVFDTEWQPLVI